VRFYEVDPAKIGRRCGPVPVLSWEELGPPGDEPLVVAVGARDARSRIRPELSRRGYREGVDYLFAA
jgi:hypothetical protein